MIKFAMRRVDNIWEKAIWTVNWRDMSLLIFFVMTRRLRTEWASTKLKEWLCVEFITSKIQEESFVSFSRLTMKENEHFTHLLAVWRRLWSWDSRIFLSRSHINQTFLRTSSFDFFVRSRIIAYSWETECSFTRRMRSFNDSNVWRSAKETRNDEETKDIMIIWLVDERWEMRDKMWRKDEKNFQSLTLIEISDYPIEINELANTSSNFFSERVLTYKSRSVEI